MSEEIIYESEQSRPTPVEEWIVYAKRDDHGTGLTSKCFKALVGEIERLRADAEIHREAREALRYWVECENDAGRRHSQFGAGCDDEPMGRWNPGTDGTCPYCRAVNALAASGPAPTESPSQ